MIDTADMTLTEVLHELGYEHRPRERAAWQGREVTLDGKKVWEGTAGQCWEWLRESGKIK